MTPKRGKIEKLLVMITLIVAIYVCIQDPSQIPMAIGFGAVVGVVIGPRAAVDIALPTGWDAGKLFQFQNLKSGLTGEQLIAKAAAAIGAVNNSLMALYGGIVYITNTPFAYTRQGGDTGKTPIANEYKDADPVKSGANIGHMLPIVDYKDALAWTPIYLRDAYEGQIDADIALIADRWYNRVNADILTRMLTNTENTIGTGGYDVPWARGTGTNVNYIPPQKGSTKFTSSHTHFLGVAGTDSADYQTLLNNMAKELRHHRLTGGVLVAMVSDADQAKYRGMADFIKIMPDQIIITAGDANAPVYTVRGSLTGVPGEVFGYFNSDYGLVELRANESIPTGYVFMTVSYGVNDSRNGIAVREYPGIGFGLMVKPQLKHEPQPTLDKLLFEATHGVGVNDRLNGVVGRTGNATFSNPDLSSL